VSASPGHGDKSLCIRATQTHDQCRYLRCFGEPVWRARKGVRRCARPASTSSRLPPRAPCGWQNRAVDDWKATEHAPARANEQVGPDLPTCAAGSSSTPCLHRHCQHTQLPAV